MNQKGTMWIRILLTIVLIAIIIDITIHFLVLTRSIPPSRCLTIPKKFVVEYPECADKLIQAANLTNIRIIPYETLNFSQYNQTHPYQY